MLVRLVPVFAVMMLVLAGMAIVAVVVVVLVVMAVITVVVLVLAGMAVIAMMMFMFVGMTIVAVMMLVFVRMAVAGNHERRRGSCDGKGQQQGNERISGSHVSGSPWRLLRERQTVVDPLRFVNQKSRPGGPEKAETRRVGTYHRRGGSCPSADAACDCRSIACRTAIVQKATAANRLPSTR